MGAAGWPADRHRAADQRRLAHRGRHGRPVAGPDHGPGEHGRVPGIRAGGAAGCPRSRVQLLALGRYGTYVLNVWAVPYGWTDYDHFVTLTYQVGYLA